MASALQPAIDAVLAVVEAVTPTTDSGIPFARRGTEKVPAATRAPRRLYDLEFDGLTGSSPFRGARVANVRLLIDYPAARAERALEAVLAEDSEELVRALQAPRAWASTPIVLRVLASTTVDRTAAEPQAGRGTGILRLVLAAEITYQDSQDDP